jgi:hypothetical protein
MNANRRAPKRVEFLNPVGVVLSSSEFEILERNRIKIVAGKRDQRYPLDAAAGQFHR